MINLLKAACHQTVYFMSLKFPKHRLKDYHKVKTSATLIIMTLMTAKKSVDLFIPFPFSMLVEVAAEILLLCQNYIFEW